MTAAFQTSSPGMWEVFQGVTAGQTSPQGPGELECPFPTRMLRSFQRQRHWLPLREVPQTHFGRCAPRLDTPTKSYLGVREKAGSKGNPGKWAGETVQRVRLLSYPHSQPGFDSCQCSQYLSLKRARRNAGVAQTLTNKRDLERTDLTS